MPPQIMVDLYCTVVLTNRASNSRLCELRIHYCKRMGEVRNGVQKVRKYLLSETFYGPQAVSYEDIFSRIIRVGGIKTFP